MRVNPITPVVRLAQGFNKPRGAVIANEKHPCETCGREVDVPIKKGHRFIRVRWCASCNGVDGRG